MRTSLIVSFFLAIFLIGCAGSSRQYEAKLARIESVRIVPPLTVQSERDHYVDLGIVTCISEYDSYSKTSLETCRDQLRDNAAKKSGQFVTIEVQEAIPCVFPKDKAGCVKMSGRAYKRKVADEAQPPAASTPHQ